MLTFRNDGWFNMTKAAKHFGKRLQDFMDNKETKNYMAALTHAISSELTEAKSGRYHGGTWAHPKLAVFFARWLDTKFAVWCDIVIDDILRGKAEVVVTKPEQSEILKMPTTMLEAGKLWLATSLGLMPGNPAITPRVPAFNSVGYAELKRLPITSQRGYHLNPEVGTWAHPKLAVLFAQ